MPYESEKQAKLMRAVAHGWHPTGMKHTPSQAVARKFEQDAMVKALRGGVDATRRTPRGPPGKPGAFIIGVRG